MPNTNNYFITTFCSASSVPVHNGVLTRCETRELAVDAGRELVESWCADHGFELAGFQADEGKFDRITIRFKITPKEGKE